MVRTRTVLLKPAHASRREIFSHQFARHHARNPRPSIIQFPSAEATAAEYRLRSFDFSASDVFTYSPPSTDTEAGSSPDPNTPPPTPQRSPSPMDSTSNTAVIRTFDSNDGLAAVYAVIGDPVARTLMRLILGPAAQQLPEPSANDLVPIVDYGVHRYRIQPVLAYQYRLIFDTLAAIILCAANDHNPYVNGAGPRIPMAIPLRALIEVDNRVPAVCLFRSYPHITFENREYDSITEGVDVLITLQKVRNYFLSQLADFVRRSIESGYFSAWNFGAPLGMSRVEFVRRVTSTFTYGGYSELAVYMRDKAEQSEIDFACARLVSANASRLVFTERATDPINPLCYIAAWPSVEPPKGVPHAPADQIVRLTATEDGVKDIEAHLKQLALESEEESMEIEPWVL
ncbi:hypothetical protein B0H14DRAFT_2687753 [Mycena olivaceomarginata]|nr:hypothetical protein B0H14DRAFT_2687753 [Mycena olivaceomarginata]